MRMKRISLLSLSDKFFKIMKGGKFCSMLQCRRDEPGENANL